MTSQDTVDQLLAQHASLRAIMDHCSELADDLDAGRDDAAPLLSAVARLRGAFEAHNKFEERVLRPLLRDTAGFAEVRIERMVLDHVAEHVTMHDRLHTGPTAELRDTMATLRGHLLDEERYFLSARIVHDGVVVVEGGG